MSAYTVKAGDTLSKIARDVLGDMSRWDEIAAMNGIDNPDLIFPGQVLELPSPSPAGAAGAGSGGVTEAPGSPGNIATAGAAGSRPDWRKLIKIGAFVAVGFGLYQLLIGGKRRR